MNMGRHDDDLRIYRTFEEFEREELRRDAGGSVDQLLDELFSGELDFDSGSARRSKRDDDQDDDE
jgi:hypothetical protein